MIVSDFRIAIDDSVLDDLRDRLRRTRFAPDFGNDDGRYGVNGDYLRSFVHYWAEMFDWRVQEERMNRFSHFRTVVDDIPVHFIHERGKGPRPLPLILTHGWPWSFWDLQQLIVPLTDPEAHGGRAEDAFDVVIPSLPGFGFSTPLRKTGIGIRETAGLWRQLMKDGLGYQRFAAQGADFGASVTHHLGHAYPEDLIGVHLSSYFDMYDRDAPDENAMPRLARLQPGQAEYGPGEEGWAARKAAAQREHFAHWVVQAGEPQTISFAMHDSPAGMAAWILERRRNWSDCGGDVESVFSRDALCTLFTLYWVTESFGTSARYYYENFRRPRDPVHDAMLAIAAPTAVGVFPRDFAALNPRRWAEEETNLKRWTVFPSGGHFGGAEKPNYLVEDLRAFFRPMRD